MTDDSRSNTPGGGGDRSDYDGQEDKKGESRPGLARPQSGSVSQGAVTDKDSLVAWRNQLMLDTDLHHVPKYILMGLPFQLDENTWTVKVNKKELAERINISYSTVRGNRFDEALNSGWVEKIGEYGRPTKARPVYEPLLRLVFKENEEDSD